MKYRHGFHAGNFADIHKHVDAARVARRAAAQGQGLSVSRHSRRARRLRSRPASRRGRKRAQGSTLSTHGLTSSGAARVRHAVAALAEPQRERCTRIPARPLSLRASCAPQDRAVLVELVPRSAVRSSSSRPRRGAAPRPCASNTAMASSGCAPACHRRAPGPHLHRPALRGDATATSRASARRSWKPAPLPDRGASPRGTRSRTSATSAPGRLRARCDGARSAQRVAQRAVAVSARFPRRTQRLGAADREPAVPHRSSACAYGCRSCRRCSTAQRRGGNRREQQRSRPARQQCQPRCSIRRSTSTASWAIRSRTAGRPSSMGCSPVRPARQMIYRAVRRRRRSSSASGCASSSRRAVAV